MIVCPSYLSVVVLLLRWTARLTAAALLVLLMLIAIGEGLPPFWRLALPHGMQFAALLLAGAGLALLWRWELLGGGLVLAGTLAFYALEFAQAGRFPGGWAFPLLYLPGLLAVSATGLHRLCAASGAAG